MLISVKFRGEEHDVDVTERTHPEWHFYGLTTEQQDALKITAEEEEDITSQVCDALYDMAVNSCHEDF